MLAHEQLKRYHAAIRDLTRAVSIDPKLWRLTSTAPSLSRARHVSRGGRRRHAGSYPATRRAAPRHLLLRARANEGDKKFNAALDDLNKLIEAKPDLVDAYIERGIVSPRRAASTTPWAT